MNHARFQAPGFFPGAIVAALDRIEAAAFTPDLAASARADEIRDGLRQARDATRDATACLGAAVAQLNTALGLSR